MTNNVKRMTKKTIKITMSADSLVLITNQIKKFTLGVFANRINAYALFSDSEDISAIYHSLASELTESLITIITEIRNIQAVAENVEIHSIEFIPMGGYIAIEFHVRDNDVVYPLRLIIQKITDKNNVIPFSLKR